MSAVTIGTQYFRPPNPEREVWEADFANIKQLGLDMVRCWLFWRIVNPRDGGWVWDDYDAFMDLADQHGLKVVIQLIPESQPQWFLRRHKELWPRDAYGRLLGQTGSSIASVGGYPGILLDHCEVQDAIQTFYTAAATRYADHAALLAWDVWNEIQPQGLVSFDAVTTAAWQRFLEKRYGDIAAFNARLLQQFESFDEIDMLLPPPDGRGTAMMYALFEEFRQQRLVDEMARRAAIVRAVDSTHLVVAHPNVPGIHTTACDDWRLAKPLDAYGTSQYMVEHTRGKSRDVPCQAVYYAAARSAANGKPWWLSEHPAGQIYYHYGHCKKSGSETRSSMLQAIGHGAEALLFWQYRGERFGVEAPSWGLVNFDGSNNERTQATQELAHALKREADFLAPLRRPASAVGIYYDQRGSCMDIKAQSWVPQGIAPQNEMQNLYVACLETGLSPDFYGWGQVLDDQIAPECRLLFMPMNTIARPGVYEKLLAWVEGGRVLIATAYTGMMDADGYHSRELPIEPLSAAFGVRVVSRDYPTDALIEANPVATDVCHMPPIAAHWTVEELRLLDADILATWEGHPAITRRRHGQGELWYIATCPGTGQQEHQGGLTDWLRFWAQQAGAPHWYTASALVYGEQTTGSTGSALYLSNAAHEPMAATLHGSPALHGHVRDLMSGAPLGVLPINDRLEITLAARDTSWLAVQPQL